MMVFFFLGGWRLGIEKMMFRFGDRVGIARWSYEGRRGRKGGRGKRGGEGGEGVGWRKPRKKKVREEKKDEIEKKMRRR